ncbi:GntR family transcriptional regulator [Streptomyces sp. NP-1717]|uniref:GntR family transcriptional regulator n=1 Tax=Streptomyces sp. NP-1717 TaxID=2704470 RepID=UPI001F5C44BD|nr:GntR family transcriptional regulator [Streptomyces sp. NP-1717]MCI3225838.1 GntR family transcriptional regulator [Streptomyces sp. NP-1717]
MSQQASPRGTFLQIAEALKVEIAKDPSMTELPRLADVMREYDVSRGLALRAFHVLRNEGVAESVPGARWRVVPGSQTEDRRPLVERIAALVEQVGVGSDFPSASALSAQFRVSRPTVSKALDKLEAAGLLSEGGQGKVRTVRALPSREERSQS